MNHLLTFPEFVNQRTQPNSRTVLETQTVQRKVSRLLTRSFTLNLREPSSGKPGKRFVVKIHGETKYVVRHLLWHLLFKGIKPLEWFILYREFEKQLKESPSTIKTKYFGLLLLLSNNTRKRLPDWKSSSKSVFKRLKDCNSLSSNSPRKNLLEDILFELKIPQKGDNLQNIYSSFISDFFNKKPIPLSRIGVGYKDKGSLKQGFDDEPEPLQPYLPDSTIDLGEFLSNSRDFVAREFHTEPLQL